MPGFFNTITAPEEQAAVAAGNDSSSDQPPHETSPAEAPPQRMSVFKSQDMPMGRIMSAVMRSAAAVQGQEQAKKVVSQQQSASSKLSVTMTANPDGGPPLVNVKNAPADLLNGTQQADVQAAYNTPKEQVEKKLNAGTQQTASQSPVPAPTTPPPPDHPLEQAAAQLEASGVTVVRPWSDEIKNAASSEAALVAVGERLGIVDAKKHAHAAWKEIQRGHVNPQFVVQRLANMAAGQIEERSKDLETTLKPFATKTAEKTERRQILSQYLKPGAMLSLGTDPESAVQQVELAVPNGLTPFERRGILNAHARDMEYGKKVATKEGDDLIATINPNTVIPGETWDEKRHELEGRELSYGQHLTPAQFATAKDRFERSQQRVTTMDARDKAILEQKNTEIALERERLGVIRQQVAMNSPEAIGNLAQLVKVDPDSYYTIPDKNVQKQVAGMLAKENLPAPQKLSQEERSRVLSSSLGLKDLDALDALAGKWEKKGIPLTGAVVGRISASEGYIGSPNIATTTLRNVVPGWASLSPADQQAYMADAQTYRSRANNLLVREVKASASGRPSTQLLKMFEPLSLEITKGGAIRSGASIAARQEFQQAISTIRDLQWGGKAPSNQQAPPNTQGPMLHWNTKKKAWE